jgi:hypothetical protein
MSKRLQLTPQHLNVPTLDIGLNFIPFSVIAVQVASELVSAMLTLYWIYLKDNAIQDWDLLKCQQQEWINLDPTPPDLTYLSKRNLLHTDNIDLTRINPATLNDIVRHFRNTVTASAFEAFAMATIPGLHDTESFRIIVHCGDHIFANNDTMAIIQGSMDAILFQAGETPGAVRVDMVFEGIQSNQVGVHLLRDTPNPRTTATKDNLRQTHWKIHNSPNWSVVFAQYASHANAPTFAVLDTRLGPRHEVR